MFIYTNTLIMYMYLDCLHYWYCSDKINMMIHTVFMPQLFSIISHI